MHGMHPTANQLGLHPLDLSLPEIRPKHSIVRGRRSVLVFISKGKWKVLLIEFCDFEL
jgi:hypothetical protein